MTFSDDSGNPINVRESQLNLHARNSADELIMSLSSKDSTIQVIDDNSVLVNFNSELTQKVNELKNELLNGVGAEFDTLKELADELKNLSAATSAGGAILTKLTELSGKFDALTDLNLVETYTRAKNGES